MAKIRVRLIAESVVTVETDEVEVESGGNYEEIEAYLRGKSLSEATSPEIGLAMVRSDVDVDDIPLNELQWKVIGVNSAGE
jgi:hypothetical protein